MGCIAEAVRERVVIQSMQSLRRPSFRERERRIELRVTACGTDLTTYHHS